MRITISKVTVFLTAVLFLSLIVRLYKIEENPPGFFADEAAIGYIAYKVLTTGKDEHGVSLPVFFRSFGDARLPIPIYSNVIPTAIFGLSEFSVRFTMVCFGVLTTLTIYGIGSRLAGKRIGLLAAFLTAISPWHLHMSRWGSEYNAFPLFFSLGFLFFLIGWRHTWYFLVSYFLFGLTLYTYYAAWVVVFPFVAISFTILLWKKNYLIVFTLGIFFFSLSTPLFVSLISGEALSRWRSIQPRTVDFKSRLTTFVSTYRDHFTTDFLFTKGDTGYPGHFITRHSVRGMGQVYLFEMFTLAVGVTSLFVKNRKAWLWVFLLLLLYPLASSISFGGPLATRSIIGIIPLTVISALGLARWFSFLSRTRVLRVVIATAFFVVVVLSFYRYLDRYYREYPLYAADFWGWQYGLKQVLSSFRMVEDQYDELYLAAEANAPHIFIPFYTQDGERGCKKCFLGHIEYFDPKKRQLFAATPSDLRKWGKDFTVLSDVYYPNGRIAYRIVHLIE